jgi:prephenate dehydratase
MFFLDLDGHADDDAVAAAIGALRSHAEMVRVLGSFPAA